MLSVNSAIVALYGYLAADKLSVPVPQRGVWLLAIPAAGVIVSIAWTILLTSFRELNGAKFGVLQEMEKDLPSQPFAREHELYGRRRRPLSKIETAIPLCFPVLYFVIIAAAALLNEFVTRPACNF